MGHARSPLAARDILPRRRRHSEQRPERASHLGGDHVYPVHMVHDSDDRGGAVLSQPEGEWCSTTKTLLILISYLYAATSSAQVLGHREII